MLELHNYNADIIHVYVDGGSSNNPGPSGAGVYLRYQKWEQFISVWLGHQTNNYAELSAIKIGLEHLLPLKNSTHKIIVYSDSQYCINVITDVWKGNINKELIEDIKNMKSQFKNISFEWVKGHSGNHGNNMADKLAVQAYKLKKHKVYQNEIKE